MKRIAIFMVVVIGLLLAIPGFVGAATQIQNTANLGYKDASNNDYSDSDQATVNKLSLANATIAKKVRNVSKGEQSFAGSTDGTSGDSIEYQLTLSNAGEDTATWIVVTDSLPAGITYRPGTIKVDGGSQTDDSGDDKAKFSASTITVGRNQAGDNGNLTQITIPGGGSVTILYQATIN
ncbi:MAG: isopeptide-forming domain-containing fimbrial protein [bacterium]|nr:isopeptide-forming domain-containing fimbrial protein [bacterium]